MSHVVPYHRQRPSSSPRRGRSRRRFSTSTSASGGAGPPPSAPSTHPCLVSWLGGVAASHDRNLMRRRSVLIYEKVAPVRAKIALARGPARDWRAITATRVVASIGRRVHWNVVGYGERQSDAAARGVDPATTSASAAAPASAATRLRRTSADTRESAATPAGTASARTRNGR